MTCYYFFDVHPSHFCVCDFLNKETQTKSQCFCLCECEIVCLTETVHKTFNKYL